jgi:hypothetical protein
MRDFKAGYAEDEIAVEENVENEGARAIGNTGCAVATEVAFDEENGAKQFERRQSGFESDDGVEEAGLIGEADGRGGVERGTGGDAPRAMVARDIFSRVAELGRERVGESANWQASESVGSKPPLSGSIGFRRICIWMH